MKKLRKIYPAIFFLSFFFSLDAVLSVNVIEGFKQSLLGAILGITLSLLLFYLLNKKSAHHQNTYHLNAGGFQTGFHKILPLYLLVYFWVCLHLTS